MRKTLFCYTTLKVSVVIKHPQADRAWLMREIMRAMGKTVSQCSPNNFWSRNNLITWSNESNSVARAWKSKHICLDFRFLCIFFWKMYIKKMIDLDNFGQGHEVQHSQMSQSMANINPYKSRSWVVFSSYHRFRDIYNAKFVTLKI